MGGRSVTRSVRPHAHNPLTILKRCSRSQSIVDTIISVSSLQEQIALLVVEAKAPQLMLFVASKHLDRADINVAGQGIFSVFVGWSTSVGQLGRLPVCHHKVHTVILVVIKANQRIVVAEVASARETEVKRFVEVLRNG